MLILLIVLAIIVGWVISVFNGLTGKSNTVKNALSDIDVQLKKRYDLVPNLVETVKGYAAHETAVLEGVTKARADALNAQGAAPEARAQAENVFTGALKSLIALSENYPQLKAAEGFQKLQEQLAGIEGGLESARRYYNAAVREFNTTMQMFPANMIAGMFGFLPQAFFGAEDAEKAVPKVSF